MARKANTLKRKRFEKDPVYNSELVTKFINHIMYDGKKSIAQKQVYGAFELIKKQNKDPMVVFADALKNASPLMEVKSRRIGGAAYQVPTPVRPSRKNSLAMRWIIDEARKRPNKDYHEFSQKLSAELLDAANNEGGAIKKKETAQKMAEANKAFAHFRW